MFYNPSLYKIDYVIYIQEYLSLELKNTLRLSSREALLFYTQHLGKLLCLLKEDITNDGLSK